MTAVTSGVGTAYPSVAHEFTCFWWSSCYSIFSFCVLFCRSLFILFLLTIVLSVLLPNMDSDYTFVISKLFFTLQLLCHMIQMVVWCIDITWRPSSSVINFYILIYSSETTGLYGMKNGRNITWVVLNTVHNFLYSEIQDGCQG